MQIVKGYRGVAEYAGFESIVYTTDKVYPRKGQALARAIDTFPNATGYSVFEDEDIRNDEGDTE